MKTPTHMGLCVANLAHHTLIEFPDGLPSVEPTDLNYRRVPWEGHGVQHPCLLGATQPSTVYGALLFYGDTLALFLRFDQPRPLVETYELRARIMPSLSISGGG